MRLEGKTAVVTGAGGGLGRAIALTFGREGASVLAFGRRSDQLKETVDAIAAEGGTALVVSGDATNPSDVERLFQRSTEAFGHLDILVNNVGAVISRTPVLECSYEDWRRTLDANLTSTFLCCKAAIPELMKAHGTILNISSVFALLGAKNSAAYSASKGAVLSLTRQMAVDYARWGIRVNTICPGYIETEMNHAMLDALRARGDFGSVLGRIPLGSLGQPDDVAYAALYLASAEARWVTGAVLSVDGGMAAGFLFAES